MASHQFRSLLTVIKVNIQLFPMLVGKINYELKKDLMKFRKEFKKVTSSLQIKYF